MSTRALLIVLVCAALAGCDPASRMFLVGAGKAAGPATATRCDSTECTIELTVDTNGNCGVFGTKSCIKAPHEFVLLSPQVRAVTWTVKGFPEQYAAHFDFPDQSNGKGIDFGAASPFTCRKPEKFKVVCGVAHSGTLKAYKYEVNAVKVAGSHFDPASLDPWMIAD